MVTKTITDELKLVTQELFNKGYLNLGLGSISIKLTNDKMIINKRNSHIYEDDYFRTLHILREDLSYNEASEDAKIHAKIYQTLSYTKAIADLLLKNTLAYSINHSTFNPIDYLGKEKIGKIPIIETNHQEWVENKEHIISTHLDKEILIIKGIGVFLISRDIRSLLKKAVILENSAYILLNSQH
jgi:L-fuculose-phosphate aldolase